MVSEDNTQCVKMIIFTHESVVVIYREISR